MATEQRSSFTMESFAGRKLSYPMYCLLEEHRMALDEVIQLTKDSFYIEINIEIE